MNYAIILCAGKGTRMKSDLPKGAFPILSKPMVLYAVSHLQKAGFAKEVVVVGHKKEVIIDMLDGLGIDFATQEVQNGTAKAALAAEEVLSGLEGSTLITPADMPLLSEEIFKEAVSAHKNEGNDLTVLTSVLDNPFSYGRILRDNKGEISSIREELDASDEERKVKEINTGIMVVDNLLLFKCLKKIDNNNKKHEYYLTDLVKIMIEDGYKVGTYLVKDSTEILGVNDLYMLSEAEKVLRNRINKKLMLSGVYLVNPDTITIGEDTEIGENVTIEPNTYIYGFSKIGSNSHIGPSSELKNASIGKNVWIRHSLIYDSTVLDNSVVGPFAHLRNNAIVGENNRIGNFVELKNSITGKDTKAAHLAYIGDTLCGSNVNFGCGAITVNYDGKNKWKTIIGNNAFIGSNSNLIAPIKIEDNAFIAAGSTLNKNVPEGALAIARAQQVNKENYAEKILKRADKKTVDKN